MESSITVALAYAYNQCAKIFLFDTWNIFEYRSVENIDVYV